MFCLKKLIIQDKKPLALMKIFLLWKYDFKCFHWNYIRQPIEVDGIFHD